MGLVSRIFGFFGGGGVLADRDGQQLTEPAFLSVSPMSPDAAMQISAVYSCAKILAGVVSSLPLFVYENKNGQRELARDSRLWTVLHEQPNEVMTPMDFWQAMIFQWALRGNAYAQIMRDSEGEVLALWPLSSDQMRVFIDKSTGKLTYVYSKGEAPALLTRTDVLHIKDVGTGVVGLSKIELMSSTLSEAKDTQRFATGLAQNFGKPSGVLTVDHILKKDQRQQIKDQLFEFKHGGVTRLAVLEADMKFQQITLTPEDAQLLETRRFGTEEICRWFGVPPVLIGASGVTTWGSGIAEIVAGFHKFTINPLVRSIEQAVMQRVLTDAQRVSHTVEFNMDALLRGDVAARYASYATAVQNGFMTRNEVRQLENAAPVDGADELTAQTNLAPLSMLGKVSGGSTSSTSEVIKQ